MSPENMINEVVLLEGNYTNDPADSGGETIWGITYRVARAFGYEGKMIDMTREQACQIYMKRYWLQPRFDTVHPVSELIAEELFEAGVNLGVVPAARFLQRALNALNNGAALYPDMEVDGNIGGITVYCLKQFLKVRGVKGERVLHKMQNAQQSMHYLTLAEQRPKDEKYEFGWQLNRVT
jgi:lysozyme family protein